MIGKLFLHSRRIEQKQGTGTTGRMLSAWRANLPDTRRAEVTKNRAWMFKIDGFVDKRVALREPSKELRNSHPTLTDSGGANTYTVVGPFVNALGRTVLA